GSITRFTVTPERQVSFGTGGRVVDRHHAGADLVTEGERVLGIGGVDSGGKAVARGVRHLDRLVQRLVAGNPDDWAEGLLHEDPVTGAYTVDHHRVVEQPRARITDEAVPGIVLRDLAGRRLDRVMRLYPTQEILKTLREFLIHHGAHEHVLRRIANLRASNGC